MAFQNHENISPKVINMIHQHMNKMEKLDGIAILHDDNAPITEIKADIAGPEETPYFGGSFKMKLVISGSFPQQPPKAYFTTKIFHPNINNQTGEVCVNTLKRDWDPSNWSIAHILKVIRCLLIVPFPESALNEEAAKMFMESYDDFFQMAKMLTQLQAMDKSKINSAASVISSSQRSQASQDNNNDVNMGQRTNNISRANSVISNNPNNAMLKNNTNSLNNNARLLVGLKTRDQLKRSDTVNSSTSVMSTGSALGMAAKNRAKKALKRL